MSFLTIDIAFLGASSVSSKTGVPLWEPSVPITDDTTDVEAFGPTAVYQGLGLSSSPWPKDDTGHAECLIVRNCGGRPAVCLGGRDTRTASVIGNLAPGDTVLHSTGPNLSAQLQLKEAKRQAVLVSKDEDGNTMAAILDGLNGKVQITAFGGNIEMLKSGGLSLTAPDGTGILLKDGAIHFMGTPMLGAGNSPGFYFMLANGPSPGGAAALPMIPCMGVAPGT